MNIKLKQSLSVATSLLVFATSEAYAQRVTAEDIYGDAASGSSNDFISNIIVSAVTCILIYGFIKSKGIRLVVGLYALMIFVVVGGSVLAHKFFGKSGGITYAALLILSIYLYEKSYDKKQPRDESRKNNEDRKSTPKKMGRLEFSSEEEYYKYLCKFKTSKKYNWYKFRGGLGIKETGQNFEWSEVEHVSSGYSYGYLVNISKNNDDGYFFVEREDIETVGIDYKNNKFLSRCPNCSAVCRGTVFSEVSISCPKCSFEWTQRVD